MDGYTITALIVIYNDSIYVKNLCTAILKYKEAHAIVVVDNSDNKEILEINGITFSGWQPNVYYIKTAKNEGYAAGNNIGIRFIIANISTDYIWILNNDIIIQPGVSKPMVKAVAAHGGKAICGSVLYYQNQLNKVDNQAIIQCYGGGKYYPVIGKSKLHLKGKQRQVLDKLADKKVDFLMGASMMVAVQTFEELGLLPEAYFMYNEELDWQTTAIRKEYKLIVAEQSELIHLDSLSTKDKKYSYYYYLNRATILFTRKYYKYFLPTVLLYRVFEILFRTKGIRNKQFSFKGIKDGITAKRA